MKKILNKICIFVVTLLGILLLKNYPQSSAEIDRARYMPRRSRSSRQRDPFQSPFEIEKKLFKPKPEPEPQLPPEPVQGSLAGLQVQGMIWGTQMPQAIINNTVVRVGDSISGAKVLDIRKEGIYLLFQGRQFILRPSMGK